MVGKLVVLGVGLIGGSFALALKRRGAISEVVGVGRTRANLDDAIRTGLVDRAATLDDPWTDELVDADIVFVATPVAQFPSLFFAMAPKLGAHTLVTDAGSTKQDVVAAARAALGELMARFVPAHPIAGAETGGALAALDSLFDGRTVVLTPLPETDRRAIARVEALWLACGASVKTLDPLAHDRMLAAVSHLPHLLAAAYVADLAVRHDAAELFELAGTGFRDFTRIAQSSPEMWRDILLANREALHDELGAFRGALDVVEAALRSEDGASLAMLFHSAGAARRAWAKSRNES